MFYRILYCCNDCSSHMLNCLTFSKDFTMQIIEMMIDKINTYNDSFNIINHSFKILQVYES